MPWPVRMTLMFALGGALFHWYAARRTVRALTTVTRWSEKRIRIGAALLALYLAAYPLTLLGSHWFGNGGMAQRSGLLLDALVIYPFWVGIVGTIQVALVLLAMDIVKGLLFPIYKKHRER